MRILVIEDDAAIGNRRRPICTEADILSTLAMLKGKLPKHSSISNVSNTGVTDNLPCYTLFFILDRIKLEYRSSTKESKTIAIDWNY